MKFQKFFFAFLFCFIIYFIPRNIFSDDLKKANKYYEKYDYKLAIDIYEKVMQKKPSLEVAQKLANCYRFINDTENAETAYVKVLTFAGFDPLDYKYYADALKQNGKFDQAKENYLLYGKKFPALNEEALKMANSCDVARMWAENPDKNVQIINQSALNSENSEFSPVKSNGNLYFVSDRWFVNSGEKDKAGSKDKKVVYGWTGNPFLKMYQQDSATSTLSLMSNIINDKYHNGPAVFSAGGDTIYFSRADLPKKNKKKKIAIGHKTIWMAVKNGADWGEPQKLPLNTNDNYSVEHPALSPDGNILYFASDMPGGLGGLDIYATKKQADGSWGTPVNCGPNINSVEDDVFPYVRKDGKFYFSSKGHIGMGGLDIFTADGSYNTFSVAENLKAPTNSTKDDFGVWFDNDLSGYLSSNRKGGNGLDDIYQFKITPAKPVYAVEGEVVDKNDGSPLSDIDIILTNKTTGARMTTVSDSAGKFRFDLEPGMDYVLSGDKEKYYSRQEGEISTKGLTESTIFNVKFELERSKDAFLVRLHNIYYDFDKWAIRPDAEAELNRVVTFLSTMPNVNIQLRSHTDSRGPAVYNQWLSQKRAESAVQYLEKSGVASDRLSAVGLGETELLNRCRDGVKCSRAEHQMNRRTEFKVVKVTPVISMANNVNRKK